MDYHQIIRQHALDFVTAYNASRASVSDTQKAQVFLSSGLQLVKSNCDDFFHGLGRARQDLNFAQRSVALGGAVAGTVSGITGASAKTLALLAAGVGATLGLTEIYADEYLFSPDIAAVQQLVHTAQNTYIQQIEAQSLKANLMFYSAHGLIQEFQGYCEVQTIKSLVNAAIKAGKLAPATSVTEERILSQAMNIEFAFVSRIAGKQLSREDIARLYWNYILGPADAPEAQKTQINELVKSVDADGKKASILSATLNALSPSARETLESTIALLKQAGLPRRAAAPGQSIKSPELPTRIILHVVQ